MSRTISFYNVIVSTDVTQIVPFNSKRTNLVIRNETGSTVYISADEKEILTKGYPLYAGEYVVFSEVDKDAVQYAFYAVTQTGTANLRVVEEFEV